MIAALGGGTYDSIFNGGLPDGTTRMQDNAVGAELQLNADVELDADHDGYGDETQDQCPTNANVQATCPPTGQRAAALKKCKKKARRHDWSHKKLKKCKKKAKLLPV